MIIKRLYSEMVSSTKQGLLVSVPDGKSKIAQEFLRARLTPFFISRQDQLTVCDRVRRKAVKTQGSDQLFSIINASIGSDNKIATRVQKRLLLLKRFGCCPKHPVPQTDGPVAPYPCSVGSPVGKAVQHPVDITFINRLSAGVVQANDGTHSGSPSIGGNRV